jgi:hypothetical protein
MKVTVNIQGISGVKQQNINVKSKKGHIDLTGNGTNEKLTILAKGICNGKKVDVEFKRNVGEKSKINFKSCPKSQVKHFTRKCKQIEKIWEAQVKKTKNKSKETKNTESSADKEPSMKVTVKVEGVDGVKKQEFTIKGTKGKIDVTGKGTDKKLKIVAKGMCDDKEVNVKFKKKAGKKATMQVVHCPKEQLTHFKKKCETIEKLWDTQLKAKS